MSLDGNTITTSSGALNLTPATGSEIVLDGTINIDAGVVTGATSITSTAFVGDVTGDVTGNVSGTAATVTGAAQTAITSVGTLTALAVDNTLTVDGDASFNSTVDVSGYISMFGAGSFTQGQIFNIPDVSTAILSDVAAKVNNILAQLRNLGLIDPDSV